MNDFYKNTVLHYDLILRRMQPVYEEYVKQTRKSSITASILELLSPPVIAQQGLNHLSETSMQAYLNFQQQGFNHGNLRLAFVKGAIPSDRELGHGN